MKFHPTRPHFVLIASLLCMGVPAAHATRIDMRADSGQVWVDQAAAAEKRQDYAQSIDLYGKAAILPGTEEAGTIGLARSFGATGEYESARKALDSFIRRVNPFSIDAHLALVDIYLNTSKLNAAEKELKIVSHLRASYGPSLERFGILYFLKGKFALSVQYLSPVIVREPGNQKALELRAKANFQLQRYSSSLQDYSKLLTLNPENINYVITIAKIYVQLGHNDEAQTYIKRALETVSDDQGDRTRVLMLAGNFEQIRGHFGKAISYFRTAFATNPGDLNLGIKLGELYLSQKNPAEAQRVLTAILKITSEDEGVIAFGIHLADEFVGAKEFTKSREILNQLLNGAPGNEALARRMISLYSLSGHRDSAGIFLKNYTDSHPNQTWAFLEYARLLSEIENFAEAEEVLKHAMDKDLPRSPDVALAYSSLLVKRDQIEDAKDLLKNSLKKFPGDDRIRFNLAICYEKLKEPEKALNEYAAVSKKDADTYLKAAVNQARILQSLGKSEQAVALLKTLKPDSRELEISIQAAISDFSHGLSGGDRRRPAGR